MEQKKECRRAHRAFVMGDPAAPLLDLNVITVSQLERVLLASLEGTGTGGRGRLVASLGGAGGSCRLKSCTRRVARSSLVVSNVVPLRTTQEK